MDARRDVWHNCCSVKAIKLAVKAHNTGRRVMAMRRGVEDIWLLPVDFH